MNMRFLHVASKELDDMESSESPPMETVLLSQQLLAEDWERPEEDEAWKHLQPAASS